MQNLLVLGTRHRRLAIRRQDAILLIVAAIPGLFLGAVVVSHASKAPMQLAVGVAILAAVLFRVHEPGRVAALVSRKIGGLIGLLAGFLTTTVGINGPPLVTWLRARDATFTQLRDTLAMIFLVLNMAAIPSLISRGGTIPAASCRPSQPGSSSGTCSAWRPTTGCQPARSTVRSHACW